MHWHVYVELLPTMHVAFLHGFGLQGDQGVNDAIQPFGPNPFPKYPAGQVHSTKDIALSEKNK